ncbi:MAG TPA: methyltransferase domain-containing protein [Candidatus Binatus sp.]|nr:methyltransferase domain-containing protein [Candidatus Binatus sp.]
MPSLTAKKHAKKKSISDAAFKIRYLRRSRELWRRYLEGKTWIGQMYRQFLGLRPGITIIDVGCGTGDFTRYLASLTPGKSRVIGVDSRAASVKAATKETEKTGLFKSISYRVGDVNKLPFADDYSDLTSCRTLLMHLPDPLIAVKEMTRITRSGGNVAAVEPGGMRTFHDPNDEIFTRLSLRVEESYRKGIRKLEGKQFDIGERLPGIFQKAGLAGIRTEIHADSWINSDPRRKTRDVRDEIRFGWQMFKQNQETETRYMLAGGLTKNDVRTFIRQQERRIKEYLSDDEKLRNDVSTYGASFFIVVGTKPA